MIGHKLITKQTGPSGKICNSVFMCERKYIRKEYYLAILMDRGTQGPVVVVSEQGGMDIEAVAAENPEAIISQPIDINVGVTQEIADKLVKQLNFAPQTQKEAADIIQKLYNVFIERDATQIEINPLAEDSDHRVMCMDAKFSFDDNADFRQKEVFSWRDRSQEDPSEVKAAEFGLNFIKLDGNIGCLVNGAGLAMATLDIVQLFNGKPANFLDCGGGATAQAIEEALQLITAESKVKSPYKEEMLSIRSLLCL